MLVDSKIECEKCIKLGSVYCIFVRNMTNHLLIKFQSSQEQLEWYDFIHYMINVSGQCFFEKSMRPFSSFAPRRNGQMCRWFINASEYFENIMHGLNNAKEEIYIADWWLCPELFLIRPTDDLQYRLDTLLLKKAKEGVKIYILLYKEVKIVLNLYSLRTKQVLTENGKNPNIRILRCPDNFLNGFLLWSHHEKFVVIDQSVAFIGGIDLCYGRWDDHNHK
jgi:phospholipase D1/2